MKKNPARNVHLKKGPSKLLEAINVSIDVDQRLYREDIEGSIAHTKMLGHQKIISKKDQTKIISGLKKILKDIEAGKVKFKKELEDIHMNIEVLLNKKIGSVAGKLHTARSRNDQGGSRGDDGPRQRGADDGLRDARNGVRARGGRPDSFHGSRPDHRGCEPGRFLCRSKK